MGKLHKLFGSIIVLASCSASWAVEKEVFTSPEVTPAQVMLFGTFHFANPGRDSVKLNVTNVLTPDNQAYLEQLTDKLASESPTHIMLECDPGIQDKIDRKFQSYLNGKHKLEVNESQQLGFRIAAKAKLNKVICIDEQQVHWNGSELMDYMSSNTPERKKIFDAEVEGFGKLASKQHKMLPLRKLLQIDNSVERDKKNMNLYLMVNDIGSGEGFSGADASVSWWHRNFRMYANIQTYAQPGTKVIAIAGQGHTAVIKSFLATDLQREAWDVNDYL
ncbi:DUF5694 domain-containing protein [Microbulbifer sp. GL-2]|uniref:DUF5694 domain-containing protein n=1 Tax=Microbulbifer sp. GL-2 TaxID=2591606 RepID=UPI001163BF83|nr:DUF5694 domain-containing protein [Microbulbifer sp. GL-2]BBM01619.1 hypothetical protein GL2_16930 [Microbulbifer sp. GL-2]